MPIAMTIPNKKYPTRAVDCWMHQRHPEIGPGYYDLPTSLLDEHSVTIAASERFQANAARNGPLNILVIKRSVYLPSIDIKYV